jgi:hypothetical protein
VGGVMARPAAVLTRDVVGAPEEIRTVLEQAHAEGRLVSFTEPQRVVRVRVVLREQPPRPARPSLWNPLDNPRPYLIAMAVAAGAAIAAVVIYAVVTAVAAAVSWLSSHAMGIGASAVLLVLLAVALSGGTAACSGIHCGGCRR